MSSLQFGRCSNCRKYKYVARDGQCQTCLDDAAQVSVLMTKVHSRLASPEPLSKIFGKMKTETRVQFTGNSSDIAEGEDERIEFGESTTTLVKADQTYSYADYQDDTFADRVEHAVEDAVSDAFELYR